MPKRDRTFPGEVFPFDRRVKRSVTVSSGYNLRNGRANYVSLEIDGHIVVLHQSVAAQLWRDVKARLSVPGGQVGNHMRDDPQMLTFPPGAFRDRNYTSD